MAHTVNDDVIPELFMQEKYLNFTGAGTKIMQNTVLQPDRMEKSDLLIQF